MNICFKIEFVLDHPASDCNILVRTAMIRLLFAKSTNSFWDRERNSDERCYPYPLAGDGSDHFLNRGGRLKCFNNCPESGYPRSYRQDKCLRSLANFIGSYRVWEMTWLEAVLLSCYEELSERRPYDDPTTCVLGLRLGNDLNPMVFQNLIINFHETHWCSRKKW